MIFHFFIFPLERTDPIDLNESIDRHRRVSCIKVTGLRG